MHHQHLARADGAVVDIRRGLRGMEVERVPVGVRAHREFDIDGVAFDHPQDRPRNGAVEGPPGELHILGNFLHDVVDDRQLDILFTRLDRGKHGIEPLEWHDREGSGRCIAGAASGIATRSNIAIVMTLMGDRCSAILGNGVVQPHGRWQGQSQSSRSAQELPATGAHSDSRFGDAIAGFGNRLHGSTPP